jgi:hypothetical protein
MRRRPFRPPASLQEQIVETALGQAPQLHVPPAEDTSMSADLARVLEVAQHLRQLHLVKVGEVLKRSPTAEVVVRRELRERLRARPDAPLPVAEIHATAIV